MTDERISWHSAFAEAMKLELKDNKESLVYEKEFPLNSEPISVDLLVIKKEPDVVIKNEIGRFFKGHNLIEYKGPGDDLNIDVFFKGIAYASLYKYGGGTVDARKVNDITLSFVREAFPVKLFENLRSMNAEIIKTSPGIYRISTGFLFDIQIIITKELNPKSHIWITSITRKINEETARCIVTEYEKMYDKGEKDSAHAVIDIVARGNREVFKKLREVPEMNEVLMEIMKPDIDKKIEEAVKKKDAEIANIVAENKLKLAEKDSVIVDLKAKLKELQK